MVPFSEPLIKHGHHLEQELQTGLTSLAAITTMLCWVLENMSRFSLSTGSAEKYLFECSGISSEQARGEKHKNRHQFCSLVRPKGTSLYLHNPNMPSVTKAFLPSSQEEDRPFPCLPILPHPLCGHDKFGLDYPFTIPQGQRPAADSGPSLYSEEAHSQPPYDLVLEADGMPASFIVQ